MRTKVLIAAAVLAASLASSMAQNVYSLNVVGYVNVTLPAHQFTAVANPLDGSMGGTVPNGNDFATLFGSTNGNIQASSKVQTWIPAAVDWSTSITYSAATKKWGSSFAMPPGVGALYYNNGAVDTVVTFTGQVEQGTYNVASLPSHAFSLVGAPVPIGGLGITNSTTGLVPSASDTIATFNGTIVDWSAASKWSAATKKWSPETTINPGQAFLYYNNSASANNWVSNFTVQ